MAFSPSSYTLSNALSRELPSRDLLISGRHPDHLITRAVYSRIGRSLTNEDIGKIVARTFPIRLDSDLYDFSYIPLRKTQKDFQSVAKKLVNIKDGQLVLRHLDSPHCHVASKECNDENWVTSEKFADYIKQESEDESVSVWNKAGATPRHTRLTKDGNSVIIPPKQAGHNKVSLEETWDLMRAVSANLVRAVSATYATNFMLSSCLDEKARTEIEKLLMAERELQGAGSNQQEHSSSSSITVTAVRGNYEQKTQESTGPIRNFGDVTSNDDLYE